MRRDKAGKRFVVRNGCLAGKALAKPAITKVNRWINLSGTPSPNGLQDLWGSCWFLDQGHRLGATYTAFEQRYFRKGFNGFGLEALPHAEKEIHDKLRDVTLSLKAEDFLNLPPVIENEVFVNLPPDARKAYREMEDNFFAQLKTAGIEAFNTASRSAKLLQLAAGAAYTDEDRNFEEVHRAKLETLEDLLESSEGENLLVCYHFRSDLKRLKKAFPTAREMDTNPQTIADWNAGKIKMLLVHPMSAGHGLSLQWGGRTIVFFTLGWSLEAFSQVIERLGPARQAQIGRTEPVVVYYLLAKDTLDQVVLDRLRTKRSVQDCLLDAMRVRGV